MLTNTRDPQRHLIPPPPCPVPHLLKIVFGVETEGAQADWHRHTNVEGASYTRKATPYLLTAWRPQTIIAGVSGIFYWHNLSGRTMAMGSTQPLTEMSTRNISCGVKAAGAYGWQTYHLHVQTVLKSESFSVSVLQPQGLSRPVMGLPYLLPQIIYIGPVVQEWMTELQCWSCDGTATHQNVVVRIQEFLKEDSPNSLKGRAFLGHSPRRLVPGCSFRIPFSTSSVHTLLRLPRSAAANLSLSLPLRRQ